jgi:hypothetical protein
MSRKILCNFYQENSRLSAGKQMHPFFASRMTNKRAPVATPDYVKMGDKSSIAPQEEALSLFPPIHVHDSIKVHFHFFFIVLGG